MAPLRPDSLVIRNRDAYQTQVRKDLFIHILSKVYAVAVACKLSGISRAIVYQWRKEDTDFAEQWEDALALAMDSLESGAYLKLADVYSDRRRKLSAPEERLTEFMLMGMKPDKYKQRGIEIDNSTNVANLTIDWASVPQDIFDAFTAGKLTLEDVYQQTLLMNAQQKTPSTSDGA
jgi:hypothetical protein